MSSKAIINTILFISTLAIVIELVIVFANIMPWPMYRLSAFTLITFIVLYLMLPLHGNGIIYDVYQGLIMLTAIIFIATHSTLIWSNPNYVPHMTIIPFFIIIDKFNENIIKPVIEVDWGQIVVTLTVIRLLLYASNKLKFLSMKDLKHP